MREDRYYTGQFDGADVRMDRMFRGKLLDLRECAALFRGRTIEVHGLRHGRTEYSVECRLEPDPVLPGVVNVRSVGTVGMNRDYRLDRETSPFRPHGLQEPVLSAGGLDGMLLDQETRAGILGEERFEERPGAGIYALGPRRASDDAGQELRKTAMLFAGSWRDALGLA